MEYSIEQINNSIRKNICPECGGVIKFIKYENAMYDKIYECIKCEAKYNFQEGQIGGISPSCTLIN